ncbi:MAG: MBL fold metallo-hydrolase [Peptococcaceae bacterium]|nr:MAG: MBL fold metallo-hydrolase [Peptococcaceae bacterium]
MSKHKVQLSLSMLNVYSTVLMKIGSLVILFDPLEIDPEKYDDVDLIVITHEHVDHFDKKLVTGIYNRTKATVLTTPFVARQLSGLADVVSLKPGDFHTKKNVNIFAEHSNHTANDPLTFVIKTEKLAVFHPNDSDYFPGLEVFKEKYKVNVLTYSGASEYVLRRISSAVRPEVVVFYAYPMLQEFTVPDIKVKALKQFEWFHYPFEV